MNILVYENEEVINYINKITNINDNIYLLYNQIENMINNSKDIKFIKNQLKIILIVLNDIINKVNKYNEQIKLIKNIINGFETNKNKTRNEINKIMDINSSNINTSENIKKINDSNIYESPKHTFFQRTSSYSINNIYENKNNKINKYNGNNGFILYFIYEDKEGYLEVERDQLFYEIIIEIKNKYQFIPPDANNFYLMKINNLFLLDPYKGIKENGRENGDKICVIK